MFMMFVKFFFFFLSIGGYVLQQEDSSHKDEGLDNKNKIILILNVYHSMFSSCLFIEKSTFAGITYTYSLASVNRLY